MGARFFLFKPIVSIIKRHILLLTAHDNTRDILDGEYNRYLRNHKPSVPLFILAFL